MKPFQAFTLALFGLAFFLIFASLTGCADIDPPPSVCSSHPYNAFINGSFACNDSTAPSCAFDARDLPVDLSPESPVHSVCHCVGGRYACWGPVR